MAKFWHLAWHEYYRHLSRRRFIIVLFSVPLMLAVMVLLILLVMWVNSNPTPIGYIDHSGLLANALPQPAVKWPERTIPMLPYTDEASAKADLQAGELQAYYVLPSDYLNTGQAQQVYLKEPKGINTQQFNSFLAVNLLKDQPTAISHRILTGNDIVVQTADKSREASQKSFGNIILPFIAGILFIVAMSTSSGYLMNAVVEEKENRTMEILVTSVSPGQLMGGKIIGDIAIGFTQLAVWAAFIVLFIKIGSRYIPLLGGIQLPIGMIGLLIAVMLPAFVMISGMMAAIGATVTEASEGQQIMGLFTIPIWLPYILISSFFQNPNSPLAVAMSLFPPTAPMTIAMRMGITNIPTWQIIVSVSLLVLSAIGSVWLAGRAFRLGMLRYGQRLRLSEVFRRQGA